MSSYRSLTAAVAVIALAAFAVPAQAQQAAGYTNPFESASDFPSTWYQYGYPFQWAVDASPIGGHSGSNSFNWNNGTDINGDYPYGYWYTAPMNMAQYDTPVIAFWCRYDMNSDPWYDYREIYIYDNNSGDYYYAPFMIDNDGNGQLDLDCGSIDTWHQHQIQLSPSLASSGQLVIQIYTYSNNYYSANGYDGWFIDDLQILVPDTTPPDAIIDLAATDPQLDEITLSWHTPFDDDISGVTASFDLRYSTSPITDANFASATPVNGEPVPDVEGSMNTVLITGLTEDTTYYFAVKTTDIAGNQSSVSNIAVEATLAPPPPPPTTGGGGGETKVKDLRADDILPCAAGSSAAPMGVLALLGVFALAFALRRK